MTIIRTLQVIAGMFVAGAVFLVFARGREMLAVALVSASHAALLWAAAEGLTYLSRMTHLLEWTALKESRSDEHDTPP